MSDILKDFDENEEIEIEPSTSKTLRKSSRQPKLTEKMKSYLQDQSENLPTNKFATNQSENVQKEKSTEMTPPSNKEAHKNNPFIEEEENEQHDEEIETVQKEDSFNSSEKDNVQQTPPQTPAHKEKDFTEKSGNEEDENENVQENDNQQAEQKVTNDTTLSYKDINNLTSYIKDGIITVKQFIEAQNEDRFCTQTKLELENKTPEQLGFIIESDMLFRISKNGKKPVLPKCMIDILINIKHFTIFGSHSSATRISRDIKENFFIPKNELYERLKEVTKTCYLCQLYKDEVEKHEIKSLPKPSKPRESWSMDIMTNLPTTPNGNNQILLIVDDYTSFVVCVPLKDSSSKSIINAITTNIIATFGTPKVIRSDEQSSFYSSKEFYQFMKNFNIKLTATSVAAPYSNSRAESQIKNIKQLTKKFLFQEHCLNLWDEFLPILTLSHNQSVGIYGYSAEKLMYGTKLSNSNTNLLEFDWINNDEKTFVNKIFKISDHNRKIARERMMRKSDQNKTFKNIKRILKTFLPGSLVLHRQLQVSTGQSSGYKPKFTGPYIILSLNNDESTAYIEHIKNGQIIKAHFTNLQLLHFTPKRLPFKKSLMDDFKNSIKNPKINFKKVKTKITTK